MIDLDELERLADAATPGPWEMRIDPAEDGLSLRVLVVGASDPPKPEGDAAYIAALNPATVKALIARIRRLEDAADTAHRALGSFLEMYRAALEPKP